MAEVDLTARADASPEAPGAEAPEIGTVFPRRLVPTARQRSLGVEAEDYDFDAARRATAAATSRGPQRSAAARFARDLDPRSIGGPKLPVVLLGLSALFSQWDDVALGILLPEMRADFGFSLQFLLTLGSVLGVVTILLAPAMGYLADRVKRVWMVRVGALLANVASIVQGVAPGIPQLVLGRAMAGVGGGVSQPASFPLLTDYYPSRSRARVFAFLGFTAGLGAVVAPAVAGNLGEWIGWRAAVIVLGALATTVTLGLFFLREPPRGYQDRLEMGADEAAASKEQRPVSWAEAWRSAASIHTVRRIWYATPFLQVGAVGIGLFTTLYFAEEFGLGPQQRGYIATLNGVVALLAVLVSGPVADRLLAYRPGKVMAALGALLALYAGAVVVMVLSHSLWLSVLVGLPLGFGLVAIAPAQFMLLSLVIPARTRGLGMQTIAPWQLIGMALLPLIGSAADSWGIRQGMLVFVPVFLIGALILASSTTGVAADMRAARAASMADEEVRRAQARGRAKMLVCRDVDVHYDGVQALFNVDFDVEEGEMVALLGTNGAGKSSLLRAVAGVQEASNGAVFFDGHDVTHMPPNETAARGITLVPGGQGVFATLTVRDNLRAAAWMQRHDRKKVRESIEEALELFPVLRSRLGQTAGTLSGGEQQMLTLAQAFITQPRLLMIDELSLGLTSAMVYRLLGTLEQINAAGTTVILVEQSINVALRVARRAVFMERGEVRFNGPTSELFRHPELVRSIFMARAASAAGRLAAPRSSRDPAKGSGSEVLRVEGATVRFGGVQALDGVDLAVGSGEIVGVVGPNGAGKSTLFDVVSGLLRPDAGSVFLKGDNVDGLSADARARLGLGRSFQNLRLFPSMTVRENLAVARERHAGVSRNPLLAAMWAPQVRRRERLIARRVDHLLELFGLESSADKFVSELSTGTRRALDLACLTAAEPEVLLLDEPSSGLAQAETAELGLLLGRTARETGWAMVVIEHDLTLVSSLCSRVVAMHLGKVIATGPPAAVLEDPEVVSAYLASVRSPEAGAAGIDAMLESALDPTPAGPRNP